MMFYVLFALIPLTTSSSIICPSGSYQCPDSATCCELLDRTYGCCPLKNAVCCDDHIHCCPQNSKCEAGICVQNYANNTIKSNLLNHYNHICPGGEYSCLDNSTCCEGATPDEYDCCPLPNAVCCDDHEHCCPENTVCQKNYCVGKGFITSFYDSTKKHIKPKPTGTVKLFTTISMKAKMPTNVICPGEQFQCPNGYSCCKLPSGVWGCCPFVNATCCPDHLHCCPANMKCDSTSTACIQGLKNITWKINKPAERILKNDVICPDKKHCPAGTTCCALDDTKYGCCPYPKAVCCPDHLHCCPNGFECDEIYRQCVRNNNYILNFLSEYLKRFHV